MKMKIKRGLPLLLTALVLMIALTACGKSPDPVPEKPDQAETETTETQTPTVSETPEDAGKKDTADKPAEEPEKEEPEKEEPAKEDESAQQPQAPEEQKPTPEKPEESSNELPEPKDPAAAIAHITEQVLARKWLVISHEGDAEELTQMAQDTVSTLLTEMTGREPKKFPDTMRLPGYTEVLIGNTSHDISAEAAKGLKSLDYRIVIKDEQVALVGGTRFSTLAAAAKFTELIKKGQLTDFSTAFSYHYQYQNEHSLHPLCTDSSSFVPSWSKTFKPASWAGDFRETLFTITHDMNSGASRPTTFAHRGDMSYYPEGSMEALVSAYLAGADVVEVDVSLTKDGIPVSFHDDSLEGKTNWSEMAGKNGLPESDLFADWTFAELKQLRYVKNGVITDCRIISLYDAMAFAGGKMLLALDFKNDLQVDLEEDVYPIARDADGLDTLFRNMGVNLAMQWTTKEGVSQRYIENAKFYKACLDANGSTLPGLQAFYNTELFRMKPFNGDYESQNETEETWDKLLKKGRFIGTNRIVAMCNYFDKTYGPSDYSKIAG